MVLGIELRALHVLRKFAYHGAKSPAGFSICLFSSKQQFRYVFQSGFYTGGSFVFLSSGHETQESSLVGNLEEKKVQRYC